MIELTNHSLTFSFPEVHPHARMHITFERTLRIPDDEKTYPLPPGLGNFPLRLIDDYADSVPSQWLEHGGVIMPMYQSEALWFLFNGESVPGYWTTYPFAVKIAAGKINAISGDAWSSGLQRKPQDYLVVPGQPWLDGFCVEKGTIRQFVAMPLGAGYSAEEQLTGAAEHGGIQIAVFPMKREAFERRFPQREHDDRDRPVFYRLSSSAAKLGMGLAPGGKMRQQIYEDPFALGDWDMEHTSRCFVHIANSLIWRSITHEDPPSTPFTAREYTKAGLPWFDYYSDAAVLEGSSKLGGIKSVAEMGKEKGDVPLPENETVTPEQIIELRKQLKKNQVREAQV